VSRQSYGSFVFTECVSLVVVSLVPRTHLYWSGYETNLSRGSSCRLKRWKPFRLLVDLDVSA